MFNYLSPTFLLAPPPDKSSTHEQPEHAYSTLAYEYSILFDIKVRCRHNESYFMVCPCATRSHYLSVSLSSCLLVCLSVSLSVPSCLFAESTPWSQLAYEYFPSIWVCVALMRRDVARLLPGWAWQWQNGRDSSRLFLDIYESIYVYSSYIVWLVYAMSVYVWITRVSGHVNCLNELPLNVLPPTCGTVARTAAELWQLVGRINQNYR